MNIFSLFKFFWRILGTEKLLVIWNRSPRPGLNRTRCGKVKYNGASHDLLSYPESFTLPAYPNMPIFYFDLSWANLVVPGGR